MLGRGGRALGLRYCRAVSVRGLERAERDRQQTERVRILVAKLRALLGGQLTRADVMRWTQELWPPDTGQGGPFSSGDAACVFDSIYNLDEQWDDGPLVRDVDVRAYLRWLTEGETFVADDEPLVAFAGDLKVLAAKVGGEAIRWWFDGIGWYRQLRFCAPARGRPFLAVSPLETRDVCQVCIRRGDDPRAALIDLFEALAVDDSDCKALSSAIDRADLPAWGLWRQDDNGNRFEVARFRSYAKACAQEQIFTDRGHKQTYWVEPA